MAALFRSLVSQRKRRFQRDGFDLDLSYITLRIIAMAGPYEGLDVLYRNPLSTTRRMLETYHAGHYRVYNLCSERTYDANLLGGNVASYSFEDHQTPPLSLMAEFCSDVDEFLESHEENVVAVHCKAGKGRTGLMICAYLLQKGVCQSPDEAFEFYASRRTHDGQGVTIPSQQRYVRYFASCLADGHLPPPMPKALKQVRMVGLPHSLVGRVAVAVLMRRSGEQQAIPIVVATSSQGRCKVSKAYTPATSTDNLLVEVSDGAAVVHFHGGGAGPWVVEGDVKIMVFHGSVAEQFCLFYTWFNTSFVQGPRIVVDSSNLDKVHKSMPMSATLEVLFDDC